MTCYKFFILFLLSSVISNAQSTCGIFGSRADFLANRVTYPFENCDFRIQNNKDIVGKHRDTELRFDFGFIFGYTDGNNVFRAYGEQSMLTDHGFYQVLYDNDLVVYARRSKDYRSQVHTNFYYSLEKDSPIMPLKRKYYDYKRSKGILRLNVAALKEDLNVLNASEAYAYLSIEEKENSLVLKPYEKKKPDISARLQTTTRRPKI